MLRVDTAERRRRIAFRHRLAHTALASTPEEAAAAVVALHGTDPATIHLSLAARLARPDREAIDRALYETRTLIRMPGMRRTIFVVPAELVPIVHFSSTVRIAARERITLARFLADGGFDEQWLLEVRDNTLRALRELGEASLGDLAAREPRLREQILVAPDKPYAAKFAAGSRLLAYLAMEGVVMRRRPLGGWTSNQFRWAVADPPAELAPEVAQAMLIRRLLASYGPALAADLKWWTGWNAGEVARALREVGAVEVSLDAGTGYLLPDDDQPTPEPEPWVALLPALDSTAMGWKQRDWYLPADSTVLFDRTGNIGPTVWSDGRVVGGWAQRARGEVVWRALADIGTEAVTAIDRQAGLLAGWLGTTVVRPRFRTPLERELSD
jgi:hypothetical protein